MPLKFLDRDMMKIANVFFFKPSILLSKNLSSNQNLSQLSCSKKMKDSKRRRKRSLCIKVEKIR